MTTRAPTRECPTCAGCGQVATDTDRTPWKYWLELPLHSAAAVLLGVVRPVECPECGGSGRVIDRRE